MAGYVDDSLGGWRHTLVSRVLLPFVLLGIVAVAVVWKTMEPGLHRTLLALTAIPVTILVLAERSKARLSLHIRSIILVGSMLVITMAGIGSVGFLGGPAMCGAATTLSAGLLLGRRGLAVVLGTIATTLAAVGWGMSTGHLAMPPLHDVAMDNSAAWLRTGTITMFLLATISIAVTFIVERLELALTDALRQTKRREVAEREREAAQAAFVQAQKLEAVGLLAASVAHDFNNLLTVVGASAELLARSLPPNAREQALVNNVRDAVVGGAALTRQVLGFARQRDPRPEIFDPITRLRGLDRMIAALVGGAVNVEWHVAPNVGLVQMDPSQLEQIVMNLAVNARDAMPSGGTLSIAVEPRDTAGYPGMLLKVDDTGIGMDAATRARAFDAFFTTKPEGLGTGLGLATVQHLVQQAGGWIELDSTLGQGARVQVWIPAPAEAA